MIKLFLLFLPMLLCGNLNAETVNLGYFINNPHITYIKQTDNPTGALPEFLDKHIAKKMGVSFKYTKQPIIRLLHSLEKGTLDGAVLFGFTAGRSQKYDYPKNSFFYLQPVIVVHKNNPLQKINSFDDIKNFRIGYTRSGIYSPFLKKGKLNIVYAKGENALLVNLKILLKGRLDAVFWPDESAVIYTSVNLDGSNNIKMLKIPENSIRMYTIFSKNSKISNLPDRYDKAFGALDGEKLYRKLLNAYISK